MGKYFIQETFPGGIPIPLLRPLHLPWFSVSQLDGMACYLFVSVVAGSLPGSARSLIPTHRFCSFLHMIMMPTTPLAMLQFLQQPFLLPLFHCSIPATRASDNLHCTPLLSLSRGHQFSSLHNSTRYLGLPVILQDSRRICCWLGGHLSLLQSMQLC